MVKYKGLKSIKLLNSNSDTESDHDSKYKKKPKQLLPTWAQSPILAQSLKSQQLIDPDTIFQDLEQPNIQGLEC